MVSTGLGPGAYSYANFVLETRKVSLVGAQRYFKHWMFIVCKTERPGGYSWTLNSKIKQSRRPVLIYIFTIRDGPIPKFQPIPIPILEFLV